MKKNIFTQLLIFLILVLSFSCTSLQQDVMISSVDAENIEEFQEIESQVALLDASFCLGEKNSVTTKLTEDTVKQIDILLLESGLEKEAQSRLWALKGIIFFTEGKKVKASECFDFANDLYKGEVFTMILGSRLELVKLTEDEKITSADKKLLLLEKAINDFKEAKYLDAVAKFDEAFISLPSYYHYAYSKLRNKAWELKSINTDSEKTDVNLLQINEITIGQMLMIAQNESDLLYNYNAGKNLSENELYKKINSYGLLNSANEFMQGTFADTKNKISKNQKINRYMCARFLWNLYNGNKNTKENLSNYSVMFAGQKESPISDVSINSQDFDAVLGCIELEFMNLTDGINFEGEKSVSGIEFSESLKKVK